MNIALTGTPGTGKSTIGKKLKKNNYFVLDLHKIIKDNNFISSYDRSRDTSEVDLERLNNYLNKHVLNQAPDKKEHKTGIKFFEGHISHLLDHLDRVIILRCHPEELRERLNVKEWSEKKVMENVEAEALDVILIEAFERYSENNIFEINTSKSSIDEVYNDIIKIINGDVKDFHLGNIDWSAEILKWY
jgi:adenylate kinase